MSELFSNDNDNLLDRFDVPIGDTLPVFQRIDEPDKTEEGEKEKEAWPPEESEK